MGTYNTAKKAALAWDNGVIKFGRPREFMNFKNGEVPSSDDEEDESEYQHRVKFHKKGNGNRSERDSSDDDDGRDWFGRKRSQYQKKDSREYVVNI